MPGQKSARGRNPQANIALGVILALALLILGVGFFFMSMYFGGQSETRNAVDAGALNVGKQALEEISVNIGPQQNERCFFDVTNDDTNQFGDTKVDLKRINRIWAKALLMAINADEASKTGHGGSGPSNAQDACEGAEEISDRLASKLTNPNNLYNFFDDFSERNSVRMITTKNSVQHKAGSNWQTSLMERENESNIVLPGSPSNNYNLPPKFKLNKDYATATTRKPAPADASGKYFLTGYTPLQVGNSTCWQVPFLYDEKPHLVSRSIFEANTKKAKSIDWSNPVPNAFSAEGSVVSSKAGQKAISWVMTNPRKAFMMCMPGSYMKIHVEKMYSHWYYYPFGPRMEYPPAKQSYGYIPEDQQATVFPGGIGSVSAQAPTAIVGTEVAGASLDRVIFGYPAGDTDTIEGYMVNRINEMVSKVGQPALTASDLHSALSDPTTIAALLAGEQDFLLYSRDGKKVVVMPEELGTAELLARFGTMVDDPDGTDWKVIDEESDPTAIFGLSIVEPMPTFTPIPFNFYWGFTYKDVHWVPGSGYNNCLGTIKVKRWTEIDIMGISVETII